MYGGTMKDVEHTVINTLYGYLILMMIFFTVLTSGLILCTTSNKLNSE